jgi:hypothetical protein
MQQNLLTAISSYDDCFFCMYADIAQEANARGAERQDQVMRDTKLLC